MLLEDFARLPAPHNPQQVDPALLTFNEWASLVQAHKSHPSTAYDWDVAKMNEWAKIEEYPKLINRIRRNGLDFELRMRTEPCRYAKRTPDGEYLRDESNNIVYYTEEEAARLGRKLVEYDFAIFNDKKQRVAEAVDEWGCVLVAVAQEYRQFGFGAILSKIIYSIYPDKSTGGTTSGGYRALQQTHRAFVGDALKNGHYRSLIRQGVISYERVKQIVEDAGLPRNPSPKAQRNLSSNDPRDWLLFADGYGTFILYDKKLKDIFNEGEKYASWQEDMIKGMINVNPLTEYGIIFTYGGETKGIRSFLLRCANMFCEKHEVMLAIDAEDIGDIDERFLQTVERTKRSGYDRVGVKRVGDPVDINDWVDLEAFWRRKTDRYDEFKHFMMELAYGKYKTQY